MSRFFEPKTMVKIFLFSINLAILAIAIHELSTNEEANKKGLTLDVLAHFFACLALLNPSSKVVQNSSKLFNSLRPLDLASSFTGPQDGPFPVLAGDFLVHLGINQLAIPYVNQATEEPSQTFSPTK